MTLTVATFLGSRQFLQIVLLIAVVLIDRTLAQNLDGNTCNLKDNAGQGTCQLRSKCPYYQHRIPGRPSPKICGYKSPNLPYLCCPADGAAEPSQVQTQNRIEINRNERISIQKCQEYIPEQQYVGYSVGGVFQREVVANCKDKTVPLIVGGKDAEAGEFPFMAALGWEESSGYEYYCGGTLISENFVLTAAHCTSRRGLQPAVVRLGDLNLKSSADDGNVKSIKVKNIIIHPGYAYPSHNDDIALVEMEERVPASSFNNFIRAACIWTRTTPDFDQNKAITTGWGDQQTTNASDKLQKVTLELYENDVCKRNYKVDGRTLPGGILDNMLCSGFLPGGRDSCQGDSGGPLLTKKSQGNCEHYHIIGVTSFGKGCALRNVAGVYTRVASFIDWIEQNVWLNN